MSLPSFLCTIVASWEDMNWEITWKAAEFSPNYIYNIDEYCNQHTDPTLDKSVNGATKPCKSHLNAFLGYTVYIVAYNLISLAFFSVFQICTG